MDPLGGGDGAPEEPLGRERGPAPGGRGLAEVARGGGWGVGGKAGDPAQGGKLVPWGLLHGSWLLFFYDLSMDGDEDANDGHRPDHACAHAHQAADLCQDQLADEVAEQEQEDAERGPAESGDLAKGLHRTGFHGVGALPAGRHGKSMLRP